MDRTRRIEKEVKERRTGEKRETGLIEAINVNSLRESVCPQPDTTMQAIFDNLHKSILELEKSDSTAIATLSRQLNILLSYSDAVCAQFTFFFPGHV